VTQARITIEIDLEVEPGTDPEELAASIVQGRERPYSVTVVSHDLPQAQVKHLRLPRKSPGAKAREEMLRKGRD
jgi:hypothetical protein